MQNQEPEDRKDHKPGKKHGPKINKKKLNSFLSSICEAAGMTGKPPHKKGAKEESRRRLVCRGPCAKTEWRAHLDIPSGVLCVSADWTHNKHADKHRDVTIAITYINDEGKEDFADIVFCDSEVRWLLETLWHAPIWDH